MKKVLLSMVFVGATATMCFSQWTGLGTNVYLTAESNDVGIGKSNPNAKLDIDLGSFYYERESGVRITTPIPIYKGGPVPGNLLSIFEIRKIKSTVVGGTTGTPRTQFVVKDNGNVGVGIPNNHPLLNTTRMVIEGDNSTDVGLNVKGFTLLDGQNASLLLGGTDGATHGQWGIEYTEFSPIKGLNFWKPFGSTTGLVNYNLFLANNGNVSIGTNDSKGYKFAVNGDMIAERVVVKLNADWPDYVFTKNYGLMSLEEVEFYINENSHLPNVPSAEEVKESGIDLGTMDAKLLQKIEELTLYVIALKKELDALKKN